MKWNGLFASALALAMTAAASGSIAAQTYPQRVIRLICPFPAGGGTDVVARLVAQYLSTDNGWNVVVENRAGGNGTIGAAEGARGNPDGHDLMIGSTDSHIFGPLFTKTSFDTVRDFTPIAIVATTPLLFTGSSKGKYPDFKAIFDAAKAKPDAINLGSNGRGSASHVAYELLKAKTGVTMRHVPYRGSAASVQDLVGGHVDMVGSSVASAVSLVRSGELRGLAVTSPQRSSSLPDVPTLRELGYDVEVNVWMGVFGPAKVPADIVEKVHAAVQKAAARPEMQAALATQGFEVAAMPQAQFAAAVKADMEFWRELVKRAGIEPE